MDTLQNENFEVMPMFATPLYKAKVENIHYDFFDEEKEMNVENIGTTNKYILDDPKYFKLKNEVENHVKNFKEFLGYECDFRITQSWVTFTTYGQSHYVHCHPNSILSGSMYFGEEDQYFSSINFARNSMPEILTIEKKPKEENIFNNDYFGYVPQAGDIILFQSQIRHNVSVNNSVKPRLCLAFNAFPVGTIGDHNSATELKL